MMLLIKGPLAVYPLEVSCPHHTPQRHAVRSPPSFIIGSYAMRLLNVSTREVEEFQGNDVPPYAILSHTWGGEEVTFHEMEAIARYRRSQQDPVVTHMMPPPAGSPDAMKLMLLSTMLMAFRGKRSRASRASALPALTNGYETDDDDKSHTRMVPSSSPHPFEHKAGYSKITYACGQAQKDGYRYVWVDTCCIDKRSSAELSEAINSMFSWYQRAAVCYTYLDDVYFDDYTEGYLTWKDHFSNSRWFTRAWTLPELLAPRKVVFYAKGWRLLGTKSSLVKSIEKITGIDELTLLDPKQIHNASVAQRMSWAAKRESTRPEDRAYSLMGLFGVNMPILYGEGENAFLRLQEEIIKWSYDQTIFAWGTLSHDEGRLPHHHQPVDLGEFDYDNLTGTTGVLAKSPQDFAGMQHIIASSPPPGQPASDYTMTNKGLHITLPLIKTTTTPFQTHYLAILNCHPEHDPSSRLTIPLTATATPNVFLRVRSSNSTATLVPASELAKPKHKTIYMPTTPSQSSHTLHSKLGEEEEIIFIRAADLVAPGYDVLDILPKPQPQGLEGASRTGSWNGSVLWNRELRCLRVTGVDYTRRKGEGVLYQLAVVAFWNRHLGSGFVVRVLVDGVSKVVFVDLPPLQRVQMDGEGKSLVAVAKRLLDNPGMVEMNVPVSGSEGDSTGSRVIQVDVVNAMATEEETLDSGLVAEGNGWVLKPGYEVKLSGTVTFTEKWERKYQRTVNARVERQKKGVIELSMTSMLWQAAPALKGEELDQPS
jgi:hypothetical protein